MHVLISIKSLLYFHIYSLFVFLITIVASNSSFAKDEYIAAMPANFPPHYSLTSSGQPTGFAIDVLNAIAKKEKIKITYKVYSSWPEVHEALKDGSADLIPNLGISSKRKEYSRFTSPIEKFEIKLFVKKGSTFVNPTDLSGHIVGGVHTNIGARLISVQDDLDTKIFPTLQDAILGLLSGRVDAVAYPAPVTWKLATQLGLNTKIRALEPPMKTIHRGIAVRKGLPDLLSRLEKTSSDFAKTSEFHKIYAKWFSAHKQTEKYNYLIWGTALLIIIVGFAALYMSRLKVQQISEKEIHDADKTKAFKTITSKLLTIYIPMVSFAVVAIFTVMEVIYYKKERELLINSLKSISNIQSSAFKTPIWEYNIDEVQRLLGELLLIPEFQSAAVYDITGKLLGEVGETTKQVTSADFKMERDLTFSTNGKSEKIGMLIVSVHDEQIWENVWEHIQTNSIIILVLISGLIATTMFAVQVVIGRPLWHLRHAIEKTKKDSSKDPVQWESKDELGQVVKAYNEMQAKEKESAEGLQRYQENLEQMVEDRTKELSDAYGVISSSIDYAANIQRSILPQEEFFKTHLDDYFIIWEPRDRVGGDVYWARSWGKGFLIILADCTGHGVPGAFMSLIATGALDRAQEDVASGDVGGLIQRMHQIVQMSLGQDTGSAKSDDGLELGACFIQDKTDLIFSGARFSLFKFNGNNIEEIKGDKKGIGYKEIPHDQEFANISIPVSEHDCFYLVSDGIVDQVGGEKRRMLGKKRLKQEISKHCDISMEEQKQHILAALKEYQGNEIRRDDVSMLGLRLKVQQ
ncbi:membrane hypothetical protein [Candidatus Terasakiella magnetica]|uniref:HAMP domain-containing protein n=1 Tax=Candidatus Terasakiella magnetica TaxID=1867952 RepID=A0A1C3RF20_9PROT|nr:transporter substrate-binding domain-containing protein [Candidatus Terasakiella magnetica]SCA55886.1 membrane hypothetical protein [Candidatus Terasakiella magnetica]